MSELMSKIENINSDAARELQRADLFTDSNIKSLSRDDLRDLFPGADKFQMRRSIYEIIHKPEPVDAVFKELKGFVACDTLQDALKNDKVLDYVRMLKAVKAQVDNIQRFLQAHIDNLEEFTGPQEEPDKGHLSGTDSSMHSPMEFDSGQTGDQSQGAHDFSSGTGSSGTSGPVVPNSDPNGHYSQGGRDRCSGTGTFGASGPVCPNSDPNRHYSQGGRDFSSGTGSSGTSGPVCPNSDPNGHYSQGGRDRCSGTGTFGTSGPVVPNSDPNGHYSQGGRDFSSGTGSSGTSGPVVPNSDPNGHYSQGGRDFSSGTGSSGTSGPVVPNSDPNRHYSQGGRGAGSKRGHSAPPQRAQVMYRSVVSGKTFGADVQLLKKVEQQDQDGVQLVQRNGDHKVIVLFCPISSRVGSDVDAAMSDIEGDDKHVILVLMHHVREPKHTTNIRTWTAYEKVVLHVHVFYHETSNGLLSCPQNNDAFSLIWNKLLEYRTSDTSGNALGVGDEYKSTSYVGGNSSSSSSSSSGGGRPGKCLQS